MQWLAVVQQLDHDFRAISLVASGLAHQEKLLEKVPLISASGSPISKDDFKSLGGALGTVRQAGAEALIGLTANAMETFGIRMKRHLMTKWNPFDHPFDHLRFASRPRQFRALNNILKHNEGYVERAKSESAKHLVDAGLIRDATYLKYSLADRIAPNLETAICEVFVHMYEIWSEKTAMPHGLEGKSGAEMLGALRARLMYPIILPTLTPLT